MAALRDLDITTEDNALQGKPTNAQTGTTYDLVLTDAGKIVTLSNASAITLGVPANATVAFPIGTIIELWQIGAGTVTVTPAGGVTVNAVDAILDFSDQYQRGTLEKIGTNTWLLTLGSGAGGGGTVSSVAMSVPAEFSVAGSPVTTTGTLAVSKANQSANQVWAGPTSGAAAAPSFRALVAADLYATVDPAQFDARLTLTSGTPVTTSDVTAATSVYLTPFMGNRISLYDGTNWQMFTLTELTLAVPATTNTMYDVFLYDSSGLTLEAVAWTNDTTRATALTTQNGVLVKNGATGRRYVGSFRTTGSSGQTEDSFARRLLWNYYNRKSRGLRRVDTTNSWSWSTASFHQANASAANQVDAVIGWSEDLINITVRGGWLHSTASFVSCFVGVGVGSTSASSAQVSTFSSGSNTAYGHAIATYSAYPAVGYQYYAWLEYGAGSGTQTWSGDLGFTGNEIQTGMQGQVIG